MNDTIVLRAGGVSPRSSRRAVLAYCLLILLLAGCALAALSMGSRPLSPAEVLGARAPGAHGPDRLVVVEWHAPRAVAAAVFGAGFTSVVTAATGPIVFVALAAPQIARRLTGRGGVVDLSGSALVGAVTVCLGGGYLVWLLLRENRRS